eukprot:9196343-Lingulodinium_polyedra.AAC.1
MHATRAMSASYNMFTIFADARDAQHAFHDHGVCTVHNTCPVTTTLNALHIPRGAYTALKGKAEYVFPPEQV